MSVKQAAARASTKLKRHVFAVIVPSMSRTWLSIRVELVGGQGHRLWPRPGRTFAASGTHSFDALAHAIDEAFARWDRSHLYAFHLDNERTIGPADRWDDDDVLDGRTTKLNLKQREQFAYIFDFGEDWIHLCTVGESRVDPLETLGITSNRPLPYFGWGHIPDQYGRRYETDDGEALGPPDPKGSDLPDFLRRWVRS